MNEQEAKKEIAQAKEELLKAKAKLKELSAKLMELSDVMEKIEAAQGRLQKVEEKLFRRGVLAKNRFSTASIMKKIRRARKQRNPGPGIHYH